MSRLVVLAWSEDEKERYIVAGDELPAEEGERVVGLADCEVARLSDPKTVAVTKEERVFVPASLVLEMRYGYTLAEAVRELWGVKTPT